MKYPDELEFLEQFGVEPILDESPSPVIRYVIPSPTGSLTADISFSLVMKSFQFTLYDGKIEITTICSESVQSIEILDYRGIPTIKVLFDMVGHSSEALIRFNPEIYCHWGTITN